MQDLQDSNHLNGISLLLVDDDLDCREFLAISLEAEGAQVTQVGDAESAVKLLKGRSFDAIATDKNLPGMSGLELLREIRTHHNDIPVILITGFGSIGSAVDALKYGAQDYLTKPLDSPDRLVTAILKAVDHHRLTLRHEELQQRLVRAERMESLGKLAGGVAHELNNILSPMVTLPDILAMQIEESYPPGPDLLSIKEFLQLIKISGKTAAAVVSDLLTSSTQGSYRKTNENMKDMIQECLESQEVQDLLRDTDDVRLAVDLAEGLPDISCSRFHLTRVVSNLVRNAIEAMAQSEDDAGSLSNASHAVGELTIKASHLQLETPRIAYELIRPGEYILVVISDTGGGIDPDDLGKIFEPFYSSKRRTKQSGSGLGLSVVHGVVKDHGGFIDVESSPGQGTTFNLYFPVQPLSVEPDENKSPTIGGSESILVVDDQPVQRVLAEKILTKLGYKVRTVPSGREAVRIVEQAHAANQPLPFQLLLLDMILEDGFDGLATYEAIAKLYPDVNTLLLTAYADTDRVETLIELGTGLVMKPYESRDLARAVRERLDENQGSGVTSQGSGKEGQRQV